MLCSPGQFPPEVDTLGDPELQFPRTDIQHMWETYNLSIGPKHHPPGVKTLREKVLEEWDEEVKRVAVIRKEREEAEALKPKRPNPLTLDTAPKKAPKMMFKDEESFFNYFDTKEGLDPDDFPGINGVRAKHYTTDQRYMWDRNPFVRAAAVYPMHVREYMDLIDTAEERYDKRIQENFPDSDDYIDYETAQLYNASFYEMSGNRLRDDDFYYMESMAWATNFTDLYLNNWLKLNEKIDQWKYEDMVEHAKLFGIPVEKEPIPESWMPDKWRGVNYSMEILEMHSKIQLATVDYYDDKPGEQYAGETFEPNPDEVDRRAVGTIMLQYDWQPSDNRTFSIDPAVAERLEPLQEFAGTLVELQSTSVSAISVVCVFLGD